MDCDSSPSCVSGIDFKMTHWISYWMPHQSSFPVAVREHQLWRSHIWILEINIENSVSKPLSIISQYIFYNRTDQGHFQNVKFSYRCSWFRVNTEKYLAFTKPFSIQKFYKVQCYLSPYYCNPFSSLLALIFLILLTGFLYFSRENGYSQIISVASKIFNYWFFFCTFFYSQVCIYTFINTFIMLWQVSLHST